MTRVYKKAIIPKGFKASALSSGIRKSGKPDLALFYSQLPAKAACMFTVNSLPAAPVILSRKILAKSSAFRAIIANSANANCFTGQAGLNDALANTKTVARQLKIKDGSVLVNSTGIIGKRLPAAKINAAIPALVKGLSSGGIEKAAKAIMTTDTFPKVVSSEVKISGKKVKICGVAKGAGMVSPNMATMLVFILTDADITQAALKAALKLSVKDSFNCITVDGCMSTNDSVMLLANGAANNKIISGGKNAAIFTSALSSVCLELAKLVVRDGEGASKFISIAVDKAKTEAEAKMIALAIANSNLFKTACFGENPNFGRIAAAAGSTGLPLKENDFKLKVSSLKKRDVMVKVSVGRGKASTTVYTSDLTPEYIKINAEYN